MIHSKESPSYSGVVGRGNQNLQIKTNIYSLHTVSGNVLCTFTFVTSHTNVIESGRRS